MIELEEVSIRLSSQVIPYLQCIEDDDCTDVSIACPSSPTGVGSQSGCTRRAHRIILAATCQLFHDILMDLGDQDETPLLIFADNSMAEVNEALQHLYGHRQVGFSVDRSTV